MVNLSWVCCGDSTVTGEINKHKTSCRSCSSHNGKIRFLAYRQKDQRALIIILFKTVAVLAATHHGMQAQERRRCGCNKRKQLCQRLQQVDHWQEPQSPVSTLHQSLNQLSFGNRESRPLRRRHLHLSLTSKLRLLPTQTGATSVHLATEVESAEKIFVSELRISCTQTEHKYSERIRL